MKYFILAFLFCFVLQISAQESEEFDFQYDMMRSEESVHKGNLIEFDGSTTIQSKRKHREEEQYSVGVLQYSLPSDIEKVSRDDGQELHAENHHRLSANDVQNGEVANDPTPPPPSAPDLPINTNIGTLAVLMLVFGIFSFKNR